MTKSLAFSPAISGKLVLLPVIPGKLSLLPAISYNKKLHPASVFSDRLLQCSFSFFSFYSVRIFASRSISFQALTPKPITISGSHTQANHNFRFSHPSQSQFQALTPKPITFSGSHISPAIYLTYCSFRSPLR